MYSLFIVLLILTPILSQLNSNIQFSQYHPLILLSQAILISISINQIPYLMNVSSITLFQHILSPTRLNDNNLDVIITCFNSTIVSNPKSDLLMSDRDDKIYPYPLQLLMNLKNSINQDIVEFLLLFSHYSLQILYRISSSLIPLTLIISLSIDSYFLIIFLLNLLIYMLPTQLL